MEREALVDDAVEASQAAVVTAERERIAHELHHRVIGDLLGVLLQLDGAAARVDGDAQDRLVDIGRSVERITRTLRSMVFELGEARERLQLDAAVA